MHSSASRSRRGAARRAKPAWRAGVLGAAGRGLDRHRRVAEVDEVVGARSHVEGADVHGEGEAVGQQLAGGGGGELVGPLVEVHRRVQAAGLLERDLVGAGGGDGVAGARRGGEEPVRVVVRAVHGERLDDGIGAGGTQPQRHRGVPRCVGPVDHRPLVQPEAAEPGRRGRRWRRAGPGRTPRSCGGGRGARPGRARRCRRAGGRARGRRGTPPHRAARPPVPGATAPAGRAGGSSR